MLNFAKGRKALQLLVRPRFFRAALTHGVAAATEHLEVIRQVAPATLIDVGANKGQFSLAVRALWPKAQIFGFEPLPAAADRYRRVFAGDTLTKLNQVALSDTEGVAEFHVADREDSSSLLKLGDGQNAAFGVRGNQTITVKTCRLASCLLLADVPRPVLMKIDVQGAELDVLRGCDALEQVDFVYVELSFVELYEGQPLADEVASYLSERGFGPVGEFNEVSTPAFGPTQADFLFARDK